MGKLSIPRLALAITIFGIFLLPPTDSFAKKTWLEKLFSGPQETAPKRRKPRPVAKANRPATKVVTPAMAPVPTAKPDDRSASDDAAPPQSTEIAPAPADSPEAAAPSANTEDPAPDPPTPQPKPAVPADSVPENPDAAMPDNLDAVPIPEPNPRAAPEISPASPMPPAPEASPEDDPPLEIVPIPEPNPRSATDMPRETPPADALPEAMLPDPRSVLRPDPSGELPAEEMACRQRLAELGVKFDNRPAQTDPAGCSVPYPIMVKSLSRDIGLQPDAEMSCAFAEAAARFAKDVIAPTASRVFGQSLTSVTHASAYVCRPRNGTHKLSEHAFGNALDISSFTLSTGMTIAVELEPPEKNGQFIAALRRAACGPFKTVLGPGSDVDHAEHLHVDLAPRRNGGTVCE